MAHRVDFAPSWNARYALHRRQEKHEVSPAERLEAIIGKDAEGAAEATTPLPPPDRDSRIELHIHTATAECPCGCCAHASPGGPTHWRFRR